MVSSQAQGPIGNALKSLFVVVSNGDADQNGLVVVALADADDHLEPVEPIVPNQHLTLGDHQLGPVVVNGDVLPLQSCRVNAVRPVLIQTGIGAVEGLGDNILVVDDRMKEGVAEYTESRGKSEN